MARALAVDDWDVVVGARTREKVEHFAAEIGARAVEVDVASRQSVERALADAGAIDLLVATPASDPPNLLRGPRSPRSGGRLSK